MNRSVSTPMSQATPTGEPASRRREVLRVLRGAAHPMSIIAIADVLNVHPNTVRFHLDSLLAEGQVEQVEKSRNGPGRPALMFAAVRQMDRGGTRHYRLLAEILTAAFAAERNPRAKALAAGKAWGRRLDATMPPPPGEAPSVDETIDHLVGALDELGFAPERREADGRQQIGLRHCPFLELAENRTSVICPVHLGLMQGAMETWDAQVTVDALEPFAEPDLCLAHLAPRASAS
ncbi:helix-turn-helix transcriptional regulator [Mycobacterium sp. Marseille-P9652]|uniref:helix-turn-helix transcriptional regulator n=1 Tax=Mycobacterium sp. Marseille-P9652 TaxID=2654950 RepID=UPI0012E964BD|nr:helix-turn-helix domain-containing protein [Mycobacterium sp. Marseille-P9652]